MGAAGVALFIACVFAGRAALDHSPPKQTVGLDFIAFYTAGHFVLDGQSLHLYDFDAIRRYQHGLAASYGVDIGRAYGPWWNPPFYALLFVPLAKLPYPAALNLWLGLAVASVAAACFLLVRMLPAKTDWKSWALVPVLVALSTPFLLALSHGQNTCTSLLLLTVVVTLWRKERAFAVGLVCGLMFYKPQLAAVLSAVLILDLGWRAAAGLAATGGALLLITLVALPGTLSLFLHQLPHNLHLVQVQSTYMWERHVTLKAFWRLLLQGRGPGEPMAAVTLLTLSMSVFLGGWLLRQSIRRDRDRDRLIATTIVVAPLLMPFYFDYDLLLLAVAAVLLVREKLLPVLGERDDNPWPLALWSALYVVLMLNADVAERFRLNLAVPVLFTLGALSLRRVARSPASHPATHEAAPLRAAA